MPPYGRAQNFRNCARFVFWNAKMDLFLYFFLFIFFLAHLVCTKFQTDILVVQQNLLLVSLGVFYLLIVPCPVFLHKHDLTYLYPLFLLCKCGMQSDVVNLFSGPLCCSVLHCFVLHSILLYCTVLY